MPARRPLPVKPMQINVAQARRNDTALKHGSIILTTNRGIADWGQIFEDTTVVTGDSYRMRRHRAAIQALRPATTGHPQG